MAFFHVASLFSAGVDNEKVRVDNEKALELTNSRQHNIFKVLVSHSEYPRDKPLNVQYLAKDCP